MFVSGLMLSLNWLISLAFRPLNCQFNFGEEILLVRRPDHQERAQLIFRLIFFKIITFMLEFFQLKLLDMLIIVLIYLPFIMLFVFPLQYGWLFLIIKIVSVFSLIKFFEKLLVHLLTFRLF